MQQIIFIAHRQASNYQLPTTRNRSAGSAGCCDAAVAELQIDALGQFSLHYTLLLQLPLPSLPASTSLSPSLSSFLLPLQQFFMAFFLRPVRRLILKCCLSSKTCNNKLPFWLVSREGAEVGGGRKVDLRFPAAVCCQRANYKLRPLAIDGVTARCRAPFACLI